MRVHKYIRLLSASMMAAGNAPVKRTGVFFRRARDTFRWVSIVLFGDAIGHESPRLKFCSLISNNWQTRIERVSAYYIKKQIEVK